MRIKGAVRGPEGEERLSRVNKFHSNTSMPESWK